MRSEIEDSVELELICFNSLSLKAGYELYGVIRVWLANRNIRHEFKWHNTGKWIPDYIVLDRESAVVFRLVFNI